MACRGKKLKITSSRSKSSAFSSEEDEILIELVAQNPTLYDLKLESYKDGLKRETIWKEIGSSLSKTSGNCKKRWKYIKDSYNRYKRKIKAGTGNADLPKTSKWKFYERLKFLELSSSRRKKICNIPSIAEASQNDFMATVENEDIDSNEKDNRGVSDDTQPSKSTTVKEHEGIASIEDINNTENISKQNINDREIVQQTAPKKKRQAKQDGLLQYMKKRDAQRQALLKQACEEIAKKNTDEDDVNSFGDHIKSVLKKLPPILKAKAKAEIFNVMSKYELMSMESPYSTTSTSSMSNYSTYAVPSVITSPTSLQQRNNEDECTNIPMSV